MKKEIVIGLIVVVVLIVLGVMFFGDKNGGGDEGGLNSIFDFIGFFKQIIPIGGEPNPYGEKEILKGCDRVEFDRAKYSCPEDCIGAYYVKGDYSTCPYNRPFCVKGKCEDRVIYNNPEVILKKIEESCGKISNHNEICDRVISGEKIKGIDILMNGVNQEIILTANQKFDSKNKLVSEEGVEVKIFTNIKVRSDGFSLKERCKIALDMHYHICERGVEITRTEPIPLRRDLLISITANSDVEYTAYYNPLDNEIIYSGNLENFVSVLTHEVEHSLNEDMIPGISAAFREGLSIMTENYKRKTLFYNYLHFPLDSWKDEYHDFEVPSGWIDYQSLSKNEIGEILMYTEYDSYKAYLQYSLGWAACEFLIAKEEQRLREVNGRDENYRVDAQFKLYTFLRRIYDFKKFKEMGYEYGEPLEESLKESYGYEGVEGYNQFKEEFLNWLNNGNPMKVVEE